MILSALYSLQSQLCTRRPSPLHLLIALLLFHNRPTPADELPTIIVNNSGTGFQEQTSGRPFNASGFNYDHDIAGQLIEDYWHSDWPRIAEDFREMRELGARVVRIHLQFGRFMQSPATPRLSELQQLRKLLELAQKNRLRLNLTGLACYHKADVPDWFDNLPENERWEAQAAFWEAIADTCKHSPAVFCYDIMNEPVVGGENPAPDWLGPAFAGKHFVQFIARETRGRKRVDVATEWTAKMAAAIRRHDHTHLITLGLVDWSLERPGLTSGFLPQTIAKHLDFLCVHLYPQSAKIAEAGDVLKGFQTTRPLVVEETFPLKCSGEQLEQFIRTSPNVAGWISFYWGQPISEYKPQQSIGDAITADWLNRFSTLLLESPPPSPPDQL